MTKNGALQRGAQSPSRDNQEATPLLGNKDTTKKGKVDTAGRRSLYGRSSSAGEQRTAQHHERTRSDWSGLFKNWGTAEPKENARPGLPSRTQSAASTFHLYEDVQHIHVAGETAGSAPREEKSKHNRNFSDWTGRITRGVSNRGGSDTILGPGDDGHPKTVTIKGGPDGFARPKYQRRRVLNALVVLLAYLLFLVYTFTVLFGPLFLLFIPKSEWCSAYVEEDDEKRLMLEAEGEYSNPDYITDPCRYERLPRLGWLTLEECDISRRMLTSVVLGGVIGYERRAADRPAGIRTMGLVSLGSCFFTISSIMAFRSSTMEWDSSRVTAAIPTGVGFLGAGLIWKGSVGEGDSEVYQVHGLTTAASVWLSAAVGAGAGGALYFVSVYSTVLIVMVLRYGPSYYVQEYDSSYDGGESFSEEESEDESSRDRHVSFEQDATDQTGNETKPLDQEELAVPAETSLRFRHSLADFNHPGVPNAELLKASHVLFQSDRQIKAEGSKEKHLRKRRGWKGPSFRS